MKLFITYFLFVQLSKKQTVGLTGEELKQKAKEAYCKKTTQQQNNIKEAHQKLPASSPKKN